MDARLAAAPVVLDLSKALEGVVVGLYVGGSLATGDYRHGISDIDAVALIDRPPTPTTRSAVAQAHQRLAHDVDGGDALHCVYVPSNDAADVTSKHWTWAFGELFRRPLSGIARRSSTEVRRQVADPGSDTPADVVGRGHNTVSVGSPTQRSRTAR